MLLRGNRIVPSFSFVHRPRYDDRGDGSANNVATIPGLCTVKRTENHYNK